MSLLPVFHLLSHSALPARAPSEAVSPQKNSKNLHCCVDRRVQSVWKKVAAYSPEIIIRFRFFPVCPMINCRMDLAPSILSPSYSSTVCAGTGGLALEVSCPRTQHHYALFGSRNQAVDFWMCGPRLYRLAFQFCYNHMTHFLQTFLICIFLWNNISLLLPITFLSIITLLAATRVNSGRVRMNERIICFILFWDEAIVTFIMINVLPRSVHDSRGLQMEDMNEICVHVIQGWSCSIMSVQH